MLAQRRRIKKDQKKVAVVSWSMLVSEAKAERWLQGSFCRQSLVPKAVEPRNFPASECERGQYGSIVW